MKIKIAENIKNLRKKQSLTQEQLAEALGVTVGAVYKWEAGLSLPEIKLILEIADFFEISVDVLLGYEQQNGNVESRIERIEQYIIEKNFEEAALETEKTLKKYPNNFTVVYWGANVYKYKYIEDHKESDIERSNHLFSQAISLLYQNTDRRINEVTILNQIAENYLLIEKPEEALKSLKENNVCGINNSLIGFTYAHTLKQPKEAWPYLLQSFVIELGNTIRTMAGMTFVYAQQKDETALDTVTWLMDFLDSLKIDNREMTFIDKYKAVLMAQKAVCYADFGYSDEAKKMIKAAYLLAKEYDAAPVYSMKGIRFLDKEEELVAHDDLGKTTLESIEKNVLETENLSKGQQLIQNIWEELKNET